jgi:hypothetical protein
VNREGMKWRRMVDGTKLLTSHGARSHKSMFFTRSVYLPVSEDGFARGHPCHGAGVEN